MRKSRRSRSASAKLRPAPRAGGGGRGGGLRFPERAFVGAIHAGLALVLLTPLVVAPDVLYSFAVGKALYARALIAAVFALWAVLAAARPAWRPRLGAPVLLLGAGLAAALLATPFGVSPTRSLWSDYHRMGGVIDAAHWFALAVVLAAMLRDGVAWRRLLNAHLAVGLACALLAIARFHLADAAGAGWWTEPRYPRIAASFGNPIHLGAHMQGVALLGAGLLLRSFAGAPAGAPARIFWALGIVCALWALALSGSLGALAGLGAGAGAAALVYAWAGPTPVSRRAGRTAALALVLAGAALATTLALRPAADAPAMFASPLLERATSTERIGSTLGKRFANWEAGLEAFAERPLLGWGPENYLAAVSRHDRAAAATNRARDRAHNMVLEAAVTAGLPGLAAWVALWAATFAAALAAARRPAPGDRALAVFAGAALAGWLVQSLTAFYSASSWLQHIVLLGFVAHAALAARKGAPGRRQLPFSLPAAASRMLGRPAARASLAALALVLAGASLATVPAIHGGAGALWRAETKGPFMAELARSIRAFDPLATLPRTLLFENVAPNWSIIYRHDPAKAMRLLAWAEAEAERALAAEPANWQLLHALAKMYTAVADTHGAYREKADRFHARSREAAPFQDPLMPGKASGGWRKTSGIPD